MGEEGGAPAQALTLHAFTLLVPCRSCSIFSSTPLRPQMSNTVRPCWYPTSCTHTGNPVTGAREQGGLGRAAGLDTHTDLVELAEVQGAVAVDGGGGRRRYLQ